MADDLDPAAAERAARAYTEHMVGRRFSDGEWAATRSQAEVDGIRAALAAAAPTVEEVAEVLGAHPISLHSGMGGLRCKCGSRFMTSLDHERHQAERVVALWGGGER